jgi:hypothetical protein
MNRAPSSRRYTGEVFADQNFHQIPLSDSPVEAVGLINPRLEGLLPYFKPNAHKLNSVQAGPAHNGIGLEIDLEIDNFVQRDIYCARVSMTELIVFASKYWQELMENTTCAFLAVFDCPFKDHRMRFSPAGSVRVKGARSKLLRCHGRRPHHKSSPATRYSPARWLTTTIPERSIGVAPSLSSSSAVSRCNERAV